MGITKIGINNNTIKESRKEGNENLTRCTKCGKEYHTGIKNFCSNICYESDLQKRIKDACNDDTTHIKKLS